MRICLDMRWARAGKPDGIGTYAVELARRLASLPSDHEWIFLLGPDDAARAIGGRLKEGAAAPVRILETPGRLLSLSDWRRLPRILAGEGISLFHSPNFLVSPLHRDRGYRVVVTVHDLSPLARGRFSKGEGLRWRVFFGNRFLPKMCLRAADGIIADSEATRSDLARLLGIRSGVEVVPLGVEPEAAWPSEGEDETIARGPKGDLAAPSRFLLYVGRQDPNKNLDLLLGAYARLAPSFRDLYPLVLCGPVDPRFEPAILGLAARLGIGSSVRVLGPVPRARLARLYRGAALLVHPSRLEGFGLTLLEAMAFGVPVVALGIPALVEIAGGGAARLVEPGGDVEAQLAGEVERLLSDPAGRSALGAAGKARAALYTWSRCAEATLGVYERVAREGGRRAHWH